MGVDPPFSLSVVIPTHGGRVSVVRTVRALLAEPSASLEVIVVCDGDESAARDVLSSIADQRLTILAQEKTGSAMARNLGLAYANHQWVAFVDDDDVPRPQWFSVWERHAHESRAVMTACVKHWQGEAVFRQRRCCSLDPSDHTMGASRLLAGAFVASRTALEAIGGYDVALRASQNQDLGLRLLAYLIDKGQATTVENIDEVVIDIYTESAGTRHQRYGTSRADAAKIFQRRFAERLAADPTHAASLHRIIARSALEEGDLPEFRRASNAAVRTKPTGWANWRFFIAALIPGISRLMRLRLREGRDGA